MKKLIALLIAVALTALGVVMIPATMSTANATPRTSDEGCTWEWSRTIPGTEGTPEYHFAKYTQTRTREWVPGTPAIPGTPAVAATPDKWWNWSPNHEQGPFEGAPAFPTDSRGTWQGPHENGGPDQDTYGTFNSSNGESGRASWFHRDHGTAAVPAVPGTPAVDGHWGDWSAYGPWTKWSPETHTSWEDSTDPLGSPAFHGSGGDSNSQWERVWQARYDGQSRIKDGTATDPINQGPIRSANEPDRGDYPNVAWVKNGESKLCPEEPKLPVCHPVNGKGELGNGWNLIPPDQASSHIDESLYPDGVYWKHESNDGLRHDIYAVDGGCPGDQVTEVTPMAVGVPDDCDRDPFGTITVTAIEGVTYTLQDGSPVEGTIPANGTNSVTAHLAEGYVLAEGATTDFGPFTSDPVPNDQCSEIPVTYHKVKTDGNDCENKWTHVVKYRDAYMWDPQAGDDGQGDFVRDPANDTIVWEGNVHVTPLTNQEKIDLECVKLVVPAAPETVDPCGVGNITWAPGASPSNDYTYDRTDDPSYLAAIAVEGVVFGIDEAGEFITTLVFTLPDEQNLENCEVPFPAQFAADPTPPTCDVDGGLPSLDEVFPNVTITIAPEFDGPGEYTVTITADEGFAFTGEDTPEGWSLNEDKTVATKVITVEGALGYQSDDPEAECFVPNVTTLSPPVVVDECGTANDVVVLPTDTEGVTYRHGEGNDVEAILAANYVLDSLPEGWVEIDTNAYSYAVPAFTGSADDVCEEPEGFENTDSTEECVNGDLVTTNSTQTGTPVQAEDGTWTVEVTATSSQSIVKDAQKCADKPDEPKNPSEPKNPNVPTSVDAGLSGPTDGDNGTNNGLLGGALVALLGAALVTAAARKRQTV